MPTANDLRICIDETARCFVWALLTPIPELVEKAVQAVCHWYRFDTQLPSRLERWAVSCDLLASGLRREAAEVQRALDEMAIAVNGE